MKYVLHTDSLSVALDYWGKEAKRILNTNRSQTNIVAVNGCCYGKEGSPDKGDYVKYCGQEFWEFISGEANLYTEIIEPLGNKARIKNDQFEKEYAILVNKFTTAFSADFCPKGVINWKKLVEFNSKK